MHIWIDVSRQKASPADAYEGWALLTGH